MLLVTQILAASLTMAAAVIDCMEYRLPHWLTWPAALIAISGQLIWGNGFEAVLGAAFGFGILKGAQLFCRWRQKKECLGSGDAFLMLSLGALLGPALLPWGIICAVLLAMLAADVLNKDRLPFGPFLVAGCLGARVVSSLGLV